MYTYIKIPTVTTNMHRLQLSGSNSFYRSVIRKGPRKSRTKNMVHYKCAGPAKDPRISCTNGREKSGIRMNSAHMRSTVLGNRADSVQKTKEPKKKQSKDYFAPIPTEVPSSSGQTKAKAKTKRASDRRPMKITRKRKDSKTFLLVLLQMQSCNIRYAYGTCKFNMDVWYAHPKCMSDMHVR